VVRMLLTVATTHGLGDVLFTTPHFGLPQLLGGFTVGGTVELQVMLQSLAEGFAIVGVMGVFGAFNSVVSHSELVESTPRAFFARRPTGRRDAFMTATVAAVLTSPRPSGRA